MVEQLYYPEGVTASDLLPRLAKRGVVVAGGVHKDIKGALFVFSHSVFLQSLLQISTSASGMSALVFISSYT
jgi:hypothetical protein